MGVRAYLKTGINARLVGSPASGSKQWWTACIGGIDVQVNLSGSGPFLELEGTDQSPIPPPFDLCEAVRLFSLVVTAYNTSEYNRYVFGTAYADWAGQGRFLIQGPNLQECLELGRQISDGTAKKTNLPMKQAVAGATRRRRRLLTSAPYTRRPIYRCRFAGPNGRCYLLMKGGK